MKILVADDSAFIRRIIGKILTAPGRQIYTAEDGQQALRLCKELRPDVMTLDINMPVMDGLTCLSRVMQECPCPVVMISSLTQNGAEATLTALCNGAVDYIPKPSTKSSGLASVASEIVAKVEAAAGARLRVTKRAEAQLWDKIATRDPAPTRGAAQGLVLIGTSTGGPVALETLLPLLPAKLPWAVLVAQHIPSSFAALQARRFDRICAMPVQEVSNISLLEAGTIYLARGERDLVVARKPQGLYALSVPADPAYKWHTSIDRLVQSALVHLPTNRLIGVELTGLGDDGSTGFAALHRQGGHTIAEAQETAVVFGMPRALIDLGGAEEVLPLASIARRITAWI